MLRQGKTPGLTQTDTPCTWEHAGWDLQATTLLGNLHMENDSSIWPRGPNLEQG